MPVTGGAPAVGTRQATVTVDEPFDGIVPAGGCAIENAAPVVSQAMPTVGEPTFRMITDTDCVDEGVPLHASAVPTGGVVTSARPFACAAGQFNVSVTG